jgi:VanZ family protein
MAKRYIFSWYTISVYSLVIVVFSLSPLEAPEEITFPFFDKAVHLLAYALLSFICLNTFCRRRLRRPRLYSFSYAFSLGFLIECIHIFLPFRSFDGVDIAANLFGSIIGSLLRVV